MFEVSRALFTNKVILLFPDFNISIFVFANKAPTNIYSLTGILGGNNIPHASY